MTTITIILDDKKDDKGRYKNKKLIISHNKEALKLNDSDAYKIAHDITFGHFHDVYITKFSDK